MNSPPFHGRDPENVPRWMVFPQFLFLTQAGLTCNIMEEQSPGHIPPGGTPDQTRSQRTLFMLMETLSAYQKRDPASRGKLEIFLLYAGVHATIYYRLAHWLHLHRCHDVQLHQGGGV